MRGIGERNTQLKARKMECCGERDKKRQGAENRRGREKKEVIEGER